MRVLVNGEAGFTGSQIVHQLFEYKILVKALDSLEEGHARPVPHGVSLRVGSTGGEKLVAGLFASNGLFDASSTSGGIRPSCREAG